MSPAPLLQTITIKEGIQYRLRIEFHVQRDIVTGLRYTQKTYRKGIQGQWTLIALSQVTARRYDHGVYKYGDLI